MRKDFQHIQLTDCEKLGVNNTPSNNENASRNNFLTAEGIELKSTYNKRI